MANKNLQAAKMAKNDEFYTQISDIEREMKHYREHFRGATIFCNCDDPEYSNFWRYFHLNFAFLGLKKLVSTHYQDKGRSYMMEYSGGNDNDYRDGIVSRLKENGDFRSDECIELMKQADIVVTNPPFSLFREYIAQLMKYQKKFIIIGNKNAISYKEFFPLLKENKVWIGCNNVKTFAKPNGEFQSFGNVGWFTNLDIKKRHEELDLIEKYSPERYPKYVNYDAIEVSKVLGIPVDYDGQMGVPITFLDKYNPTQFEIIGLSSELGHIMSEIAEPGTYSPGGRQFYLKQNTGKYDYKRLYDRIVIKRK